MTAAAGPRGPAAQGDRQDAGGFGRGGARHVALRFEFFGTLGAPFVAFAVARAGRLDLTGWIAEEGNRVAVYVQGPEALVGAFEMACCIGPNRCLVQDWTSDAALVDPTLTEFACLNA